MVRAMDVWTVDDLQMNVPPRSAKPLSRLYCQLLSSTCAAACIGPMKFLSGRVRIAQLRPPLGPVGLARVIGFIKSS